MTIEVVDRGMTYDKVGGEWRKRNQKIYIKERKNCQIVFKGRVSMSTFALIFTLTAYIHRHTITYVSILR